MLIEDVVDARPDVLAGNFQGDLRAYRVGREADADKLENNPELFFSITYPSASLQRFVELANQKLTGNRVQGAFLPIGRMGSGKTHALIALYNLFAYPKLGRRWLQDYGLPPLPLEGSPAVMISAQEDQPDYLWEPVFHRAGREDLMAEVRDYPTISQIRELVGDRTLAIFIDEIEDWYDSIAASEVRRGRNRGFLQNLTEVASEPGFSLFLFISLLDRNPDLKALLRRTGAIPENMVAVGEQWAILQHRLFADCDQEKARRIVEAYLTSCGDYATEDLSVETMVQLYPFHPSLFTTLKEIYTARAQGIRDTLRTLANLVVSCQDKRDLLLASDVPARELLSIDPDLHTALQEDVEQCQDVKNAKALLSTIFFYSLRPSAPGATTKEIVQSLLRPGGNVNDILMPLKELDGTAFHLQSNGRFQLTPELNVFAIIRAEATHVEPEEARARIDELIKEKVFSRRVYLFSELEDIDDSRLKMVVAPRDMEDEEINGALGQLNWSNRVVLVVPKAFLGTKSVYEWGDNLENARRVVAEEDLLTGKRRNVDELREELLTTKNDEDLPRLLEELRGAYGRYVQWMTSGRLSKRNVEPDVGIIKKRAVAGLDAAYDQILDELEGQDFIEAKRLIEDFFRVRRYPMVKERQDVEDALHALYRDREIGFKGLKQNYLPGRDPFPLGVHEGLSVARCEVIRQWEPEVEREAIPAGKAEEGAMLPLPGEGRLRVPEGEAVEGVPVSTVEHPPRPLSIVGYTPLGLQELGPQDEVHEVTIVVDERQLPLDKTELEELIEGLPDGVAVRLQLKVVRRG